MANKLGYDRARSIADVTFQPRVSTALNGWEEQVLYKFDSQTYLEGEKVVNEFLLRFQGTIQPLQNEELKFKPEGLRTKTWLQVHARTKLPLRNNDKVRVKEDYYKVMARKDYSRNGYYEYHLMEDYE